MASGTTTSTAQIAPARQVGPLDEPGRAGADAPRTGAVTTTVSRTVFHSSVRGQRPEIWLADSR